MGVVAMLSLAANSDRSFVKDAIVPDTLIR